MRIFQIVTRSELGGAQTITAHLSNILSREHEVIVFAGEGDGKFFQLLDNKIKYHKIDSLVKNISLFNDIKTIFAFFKLYLQNKPDIIHLHSSKAGVLGRLAFPARKIVYTVHGFDSIRLAYKRFLPLERFLQNRSKAIVAVSKYDMDNLKREGITKNVCCVYNGIPEFKSGDLFQKDESVICNCQEKKIICIARISSQKRFDLFLETARQLPEYTFIWIGNQQTVVDVPSNIFMLGNIANAENYVEKADIFILPTNYEGLPVTIIEAMAHGKPVVASDVGGMRELVKDGENGFVVENSAVAFAKKIKIILDNKDIYCKMSHNAKAFFVNHFTDGQMASEYIKIYQQRIAS
jgi:glycosyltransferase involved in cell wall biosynthesis